MSQHLILTRMALLHVGLAGFLVGALSSSCTRQPPRVEPTAYFSPTPERDPERALCKALASAEKEIRIAMYSFTRRPLRQAVVEAKKRGVDVEIILDRQQASSKYSAWRLLRADGVRVHFGGALKGVERGLMHHKYAVIDRRWVFTGSFNWTGNAVEYNRENLLQVDSPRLAATYLENWKPIPFTDDPPPEKSPKDVALDW